jgi:antitoxin (DNA-binding transcriptional repressor) of toxin-antitoxin stability system
LAGTGPTDPTPPLHPLHLRFGTWSLVATWYIDQVRAGDELVITDRGSAVARLVPVDGGRKLDRLIAEGLVTPATKRRRTRPDRRVEARGNVSDLVAEQRR